MNLSDYFDNTKGYGVLATADSTGKVNAAVYARPHFFDENTIAFIMRETAHACESPDKPPCNLPVHTVRSRIRGQEALPDQASRGN